MAVAVKVVHSVGVQLARNDVFPKQASCRSLGVAFDEPSDFLRGDLQIPVVWVGVNDIGEWTQDDGERVFFVFVAFARLPFFFRE